MQANIFPVILENAYQLSPYVKHFVFRPVATIPFNYLPGQFITIHFEHEGKILRRSYSIANAPTDNNQIEFAAGYVAGGPGTDLLFGLKIGDTININGPFGRLILKDNDPKRYIMVATSTGITPYRAMMKELCKRMAAEPQLEVVVLLGVQHRTDALYSDEFLALTTQFPQLTFQIHYSREAAEHLATHERCGYVQSGFAELALKPEEDMIYLCGNPAMIDDAFTYLKDHGFSTQNVIREKYISAP